MADIIAQPYPICHSFFDYDILSLLQNS
jgi:hypothetical protein